MSKLIKCSSGDLSNINPYLYNLLGQEITTWIIDKKRKVSQPFKKRL